MLPMWQHSQAACERKVYGGARFTSFSSGNGAGGGLCSRVAMRGGRKDPLVREVVIILDEEDDKDVMQHAACDWQQLQSSSAVVRLLARCRRNSTGRIFHFG